MVKATGDFFVDETGDDDHAEDAADITDEGEDDRAGEDRPLLPSFGDIEMDVEGAEGDHGHEGADAAAAFGDIEVKAPVGGAEGGADGLDMNADESGEEFDGGGDE